VFGKGTSQGIAVGRRPIDPLDGRMAKNPGDRALAREQRDWLLVRSVLLPGERRWARVAVRFPEQNNVSGHLFLTDQRLMFEYRETVLSVDLGFIGYLGRPAGPSRGDFVVEAVVPDSGSRFAMLLRVKDTETFYDFFPTLLDAARAAGAQPDVDTEWGSDRTPEAPDAAPIADPVPAALDPDVVHEALTGFVRSGEKVVASADMVYNLGGAPLHLVVTGERLIAIEGSVVWAAELGQVKIIDGGVASPQLRLLVQAVSDAVALGGGPVPAGATDAKGLVLRARRNEADSEKVRRHLVVHGGGVLPAWPVDLS
jgi:hypothetical protein